VTASLEEYALETTIDYREIQAAEDRDKLAGGQGVGPNGLNSADNLRLAYGSNVDLKIQIEKEIDAATLLFAGSSYLSTLWYGSGGGNAAVDFTTTGIINNIFTVKRAVARQCGFEPDTFVLGWTKYQNLMVNSEILARVTGGSTNANPATVNLQLLASLFGVAKLIVTPAVTQAPAAAGSTGTPTDIWTSTTAALIYSGQGRTPSVASPAFCKMFMRNVPQTGVRKDVRNWMSLNGKLEHLEVTEFSLPAVTFQSAGAIFTT
jgi:hypothetical protein